MNCRGTNWNFYQDKKPKMLQQIALQKYKTIKAKSLANSDVWQRETPINKARQPIC